ncbi:MAG: PEP-utilizing enzyme, partial [Anaerolineales bacterium]
EWNDSLTGGYLWSSVNTREATPDVMTPFTWSLLRNGFAQMSMLPGYHPVGNICGRVYNNATVGASAFRALGRSNSFDASSKELYGIDPGKIGDWDFPLIPITLRNRMAVFRNAFRIMAKVRSGLRSSGSFVRTNPDWCQAQHLQLADMGKEELFNWSNQALLPRLSECFWGMVSPAIILSNVISKLRADLRRIVSPEDTEALLSDVSSDAEFLSSLGVVAGLDMLRRGRISRGEYIRDYGHRGPHEVELSFPRPGEDPAWIDEQLADLARSPVDVDRLLQEQRARHAEALKRLQSHAPGRFDSFMSRLREAARLTRLREASRSEGIRVMWVSRAFALRAGRLCGLDEEIFFLEHAEILHVLEAREDSRTYIPARKRAYQKFSALPPYPTIIMGPFDPIAWAADPHRRMDFYDSSERIGKMFKTRIKGLPGSPGQVEGPARILQSPEEGEQLQPGEILVAVTTNVGWTPMFPLAAGVITDVGAPLSHAAIVARELGIPAVVGCFNATTLLKTGDRVRMDGGTGSVTILESSSP